GTVNRTGVHRLEVSGKGINVTRVFTQLGKRAVHLTQLGGGAHCELRSLFLSLCKQDGLSVEWVESESQIRFCYTVIESDGVTELVEESESVAADTEQRLLERFDTLLGGESFSCLIISGTKAAGFSDTVIPLMVQKAKEKGLRVILDIKGKDLIESLSHKPDIIKPNLFEFAATFAPELVRDNEFVIGNSPQAMLAATERIKSIALDICKKFETRIILTDGSRKIRVFDGDNFFELDIPPVKAVNTTGCGDAFTAGLASALEDGKNFREAIAEGIRCGGLNAGLMKPGVIM
ncbi:MAG: PfkB family carbohydrate kinase, partial [Treponema sp.]|nr:PfkB family carbohydrate kinase [Treponema sp.]